MAPFPLFHRVTLAEHARQMSLSGYRPEIALRDLAIGVDNLRHDVVLSSKFVEPARTHVSLLIAHHGGVQDLLSSQTTNPFTIASVRVVEAPKPAGTAVDFKKKIADLQAAGLNLARQAGNLSVDLLLRLAIVKFLRAELNAQYVQTLELCRSKLRVLESPANAGLGLNRRQCFASFQLNKRAVLRKCGQDLFETLREVEKETTAQMRRSLFGDSESTAYDLFLNRLILSEDGRDDFLKAENYVLLGNYDNDPDRLAVIRGLARGFMRSLVPAGVEITGNDGVDELLNAPDNAQELMGGGVPEERTEKGRSQRTMLHAWLALLEDAGIMEHAVAAYEVVPLLAEYAPLVNPQQLKNALISKSERQRVEQLLAEHGKISPASFHAAVRRVAGYGKAERVKLAGRFFGDFLRYNRDMRRLDAINAALDQVNLISSERVRHLSAVNSTLYEFLLSEEQKPGEARVMSHVVLKADVRDSTMLTRILAERGQNPASYFSLGFYDPVNKLLPKYGANKIFIEGDAVILAIQEREGLQGFSVARACALALEITSVVGAFHEQLRTLKLPQLELGLGICFQESAPLYLFDGDSRIMISEAVNRADRLSACSRRARKHLEGYKLLFNVFLFQLLEDAETGGVPDDFLLQYNVGGIQLDQRSFQRLRREIALQEFELALPGIWGEQRERLYRGLVPVTADVFQTIVIREAVTPSIEARDFSLRAWTTHNYYEVCTNKEVYDLVEQARSRAASA